MSQATLNAIKVQLKKVEDELPRLRQLIGGFEKRLTEVENNLPDFVTQGDPRFESPLADLASCRELIDEVKKNMKKNATKLAKQQAALKTAEQELAKL